MNVASEWQQRGFSKRKMGPIPVIAIFDIGKTNKKLFLFDENYHIVFERSARIAEITDEDGYPCENLESLRLLVFDLLCEVFRMKEFVIRAINFSAYGASLVYIDEQGRPLAPLYSYLKPYPRHLCKEFYSKYDGEERFSIQTASPASGSLNSGLQLYRLKQEHPGVFKQVKYALHLPQYLSYLLSGKVFSDMTSLGCHTGMWDFEQNRYHEWIQHEGIALKLPPIAPTGKISKPLFPGNNYKLGIGLHDSSAALIPYLVNFQVPFVLISTGTWCISLNPFNLLPLTTGELKNNCLQYLQYKGKPVKASRLFSGFAHEQQEKRIAEYFNCDGGHFRNMVFDPQINDHLRSAIPQDINFADRNLSDFKNALFAYHQLNRDLVRLQVSSTCPVIKDTPVRRIFVDGGFSKNHVFMCLLAAAFPNFEVFAASMAQASAVGAALSIHRHWNTRPTPSDLIQLTYYSHGQDAFA
jgi:sugar (pentulose or hexulose) kinase